MAQVEREGQGACALSDGHVGYGGCWRRLVFRDVYPGSWEGRQSCSCGVAQRDVEPLRGFVDGVVQDGYDDGHDGFAGGEREGAGGLRVVVAGFGGDVAGCVVHGDRVGARLAEFYCKPCLASVLIHRDVDGLERELRQGGGVGVKVDRSADLDSEGYVA